MRLKLRPLKIAKVNKIEAKICQIKILFLSSINQICIQEIPIFHDFTIRDPRYFVILFWASFHDFEEKKSKTKKKISEEVEPPKIKAKNIFKFFLLPI